MACLFLAGLFISFHRCFLPSPFLTLAPPHPRRAPFDINDCPHDFSSDRPRPYLTAMTTAMPPVSCTGFFFLLISLLFFPTGYTLQHDWLGHFKRFEQGSRATFHGDWSSLVRGLSRIFSPCPLIRRAVSQSRANRQQQQRRRCPDSRSGLQVPLCFRLATSSSGSQVPVPFKMFGSHSRGSSRGNLSGPCLHSVARPRGGHLALRLASTVHKCCASMSPSATEVGLQVSFSF